MRRVSLTSPRLGDSSPNETQPTNINKLHQVKQGDEQGKMASEVEMEAKGDQLTHVLRRQHSIVNVTSRSLFMLS